MTQVKPISLNELNSQKELHGFRVIACYIGDDEQPIGSRFIHQRTGFTFDLLQIQTVPQNFIWVNTFPTSDMGEPHTQEHLLLGKGNKGRMFASLEDMSLAGSSAFTMQLRTCYHMHTAAGSDTYFHLLENQLDALLHPDYTDEEIRREVRNFGVTENGNGILRLEEKGSVYNEMVSTFQRPWTRLVRTLGMTLYGKDHPISYCSGGLPAAIREMKPEHIRHFHRSHYHLGNMGMIGAYPKDMSPSDILTTVDQILNRVQSNDDMAGRIIEKMEHLAAPAPAPAGKIEITSYPHKNEQQPGPVVCVWPAVQQNDAKEQILLELFIENLAGDATTNLYKLFVNSQTRIVDLGAKGVFGWVSADLNHPIYLGLSDVAAVHINNEKLIEIRALILAELHRVASWSDGSPELLEFNQRLLSRVLESRRDTNKFVNSPPGFGFRGTGSSWLYHLERLLRTEEFNKSLTLKPELDFVEQIANDSVNHWGRYLTKWQLTTLIPYVGAAAANPNLITQEEQERQQRIETETLRLQSFYNLDNAQAAIDKYRQEYDAATEALEALTKQPTGLRFVEHPPLTLDDQLDFKVEHLASGIPLVASTFDNMTSATVGLALDLNVVDTADLVYLSALPGLLSRVGVIENGKALSFEEMSERVRREILAAGIYFTSNSRTGRCELVVRGSGNNIAEADRALDWMRLMIAAPNWQTDNLARIRDVIDQSLSNLRNSTQGAEESWVHNPANAYRKQNNLLLLATDCFFTRAHHLQRLRWLLKEPASTADQTSIEQYFQMLATAGERAEKAQRRAMLKVLLQRLNQIDTTVNAEKSEKAEIVADMAIYFAAFDQLSVPAQTIIREAAKDLDQVLNDLPDETLCEDWAYLCQQMEHDLRIPVQENLNRLNSIRERLLYSEQARMFIIGARTTQEHLRAKIDLLCAMLKPGRLAQVEHPKTDTIKAKLTARYPQGGDPLFVGLLQPNIQGGVFLNSAPLTSYKDTDEESLLQFLAAKLYGGGGSHGIFMKTWAAGLAYSNGLGSSPASGRISYYAERTPELPQTLKFVIAELKRTEKDQELIEYAIAQAFGEFRSASGYEGRGEAIATDLADGTTPELVKSFRQAILQLRNRPDITDKLFSRKDQVYARVLPGYLPDAEKIPEAIYFIIGPEKQFELYQEYLRSTMGSDIHLFRLYPRDFWLTLPFNERQEEISEI